MLLNIPVSGYIGISCENGDGLTIPFSIEPVSENKGKLIIDVCDEYTYYTDEAPHLQGADVTIYHPITNRIISQGVTDDNGIFSVDLLEGYYVLVVTEGKHDSYKSNILVDPGKDNYVLVSKNNLKYFEHKNLS